MQTKTMDAFLSFMPSRTFAQNFVSIKNTVLPEISSKGTGAGKALIVRIKNKMLFKS